MSDRRRRPLIYSLAWWTGVALLVWLDGRVDVAPGALRADFGVTAAIAIVTLLGNLFGIFRGKVDKNVKAGLEFLRAGIVEVGKVLAEFAKDTGRMLAKVAGLLRRSWTRVILPFLRKLDRWVLRVQKWLRDTFGPIIHALLWLRTNILKFYEKWLRPIFDTIEVMRRILGLLSFLHLSFARKLDAQLAEIERRLRQPIDALLRKVNEIIDWTDLVLDAGGFFQRYTLIKSLWKNVGDTWAVLLSHNPEGTSAAANAAMHAREVPLDPPARYTRALNEWYGAGAGELAADIAPLVALRVASASAGE